MGWAVVRFRQCATRWGKEGSNYRWGPSEFVSDPIFLSAFSVSGFYSASNRNEYQVGFLGGKVRPTLIADNTVILVMPNVKVRMEVQHSIHPLGLHDLLRDSFLYKTWNTRRKTSPVQLCPSQISYGKTRHGMWTLKYIDILWMAFIIIIIVIVVVVFFFFFFF